MSVVGGNFSKSIILNKGGSTQVVLYHYRPIKSALLEIGDGTLHFAAREELNDPIEGYLRVFWLGDKAAWEGLLRNYVCSLSQAINLYLLDGDEEMLYHKTLMVDINRFDAVPFGIVLKELGNAFLSDDTMRELASFYGNNHLKVHEEELRLILHFVHRKALALCISKCVECKVIPEDQANSLLDSLCSDNEITQLPIDLAKKELLPSECRSAIAKMAENILEDMTELKYIHFGLEDETFLCSRQKYEKETDALRRRKWMSIVVDFPKIYVDQLKEMVYPESFVVCFSGRNDDSSMWGNYAEQHKGVCLIYETDEKNRMILNNGRALEAKPVIYGGPLVERNFFETFGRLTRTQISTWLTGVDGISAARDAFANEEEWRDNYWSTFETKIYRKIRAWEHESEYRLALGDTFNNFDKPESRNLKYDPKLLKGVIFGINTSEYDKKLIMEKLLIHADRYDDFTFYQAEYDDERQSIAIRKKSLWKLK